MAAADHAESVRWIITAIQRASAFLHVFPNVMAKTADLTDAAGFAAHAEWINTANPANASTSSTATIFLRACGHAGRVIIHARTNALPKEAPKQRNSGLICGSALLLNAVISQTVPALQNH
jgi:hypothetical protein